MKFKKTLRKYIPKQHVLHENKAMRWMHRWLLSPNLWHLNRRSVATGFATGLFAGLLPIPLHLLLGVALCFFFRGNVAIAMAATWITNPFTFAPIYYFNYKIGSFLMGQHPQANLPLNSYEGLMQNIESFWQPLLLGSIICGLVAALISYITIRVYWRSQVLHGWRKRKESRLNKQE